MRTRIIDLDGGVEAQPDLVADTDAEVVRAREWGPRLRMGCRFGAFRTFEQELNRLLGPDGGDPSITLYGSGDFHHVTLALLRRLRQPFNLLVIDNHPDWMRRVPLMHCGTWLAHAAGLPNVRQIFHVGGDVDFDNAWRYLAPWQLLITGRIVTIPAVRRFTTGRWPQVAHAPLRFDPQTPTTPDRLRDLIELHRSVLRRYPLYVSIDKDVLRAEDAVVNWDSGRLGLGEVELILSEFLAAARGRLAGADSTGDWSPVEVSGVLRQVLHATEHPSLTVDPREAARTNRDVNLTLWATLSGHRRPQHGGRESIAARAA